MEKIQLIAKRVLNNSQPLFGSVKLAVLLSIVCFMFVLDLFSNAHESWVQQSLLYRLWILTGVTAFLVFPLVIVAYILLVAVNNLDDEPYSLLVLSNVTAGEILLGFIGAVFYRLRGILTFVLGCTIAISLQSLFLQSVICIPESHPCAPTKAEIITFVIIGAFLLAGLYLFTAVWSIFVLLRFKCSRVLQMSIILAVIIVTETLLLIRSFWLDRTDPGQLVAYAAGTVIFYMVSFRLIVMANTQITRPRHGTAD